MIKEGFKVVIYDFGLAEFISEQKFRTAGTVMFLAPEIVEENGYDERVDIWAVGITLYLLMTHKTPHEILNLNIIDFFVSQTQLGNRYKNYLTLRSHALNLGWSQELIDTCMRMLEYKYTNRVHANALLHTPIFS